MKYKCDNCRLISSEPDWDDRDAYGVDPYGEPDRWVESVATCPVCFHDMRALSAQSQAILAVCV